MLPSNRGGPAFLVIEINPVGISGSITEKRGIVARSASEHDQFNRTLTNQKLIELARRIDKVNPKQEEKIGTTGSDIFEI